MAKKVFDIQNGTATSDLQVATISDLPDPKPLDPQDAKEDPEKEKKEKEEPMKMVGVLETFRFATIKDKLLMLLGLVAACAHGSALPMMMIVFGDMTDAFINNAGLRNYLSRLDLRSINLTVDIVVNNPRYLPKVLNHFNRSNDTARVMRMAQGPLLEQMQTFALYYVVLACIVFVLAYGQVTCWLLAAHRQTRTIKAVFFRNVLKKDIGWYDTHEIGELNTRMSDDTTKIQDGIGQKLGTFFQWTCGFFAGFIIGFVRGWKLTLVILAISPLLAISGVFIGIISTSLTSKELKAYAKAGAIAEEVLGSIRTVVSFGGEEKECKRYNDNLYDARSFGVRKGLITGAGMGVVYFIMFASFGLAFWYGSKLVREGEYTGGQLLIVFFCVFIAAFSIGNAAPNIQYFSTARGAAYAIYQIIDEPSKIDSSSPAGLQPPDITGEVEFRNVVFNYPSRPDIPILRGLDLRVNLGETVALVGSSGCGKSTTVQLLQRFYDPLEGEITLGGYNIKDLNIRYLRQCIGMVSQEPVLFATTIEENIRYGRDGVTQDEIEQACREANAHNFISHLPKGYKTLVGERGAQLSGGQKQRIAIARALVRNPKILLLDEATSALDTESESIVQAALDKARMGRTTIVIAHRLSTVRNANQIAGIENGIVVEKGTHDELMKSPGVYYTLVMNQQGHLEEASGKEKEEDVEVEIVHDFSDKSTLQRVGSDKKAQRVRATSESHDQEEDEPVEDLPEFQITRVMRLNSPEWLFIVLGCFAALVSGGIQPAFAVVFAEILGVYARDPSRQEYYANLYSGLFVVLGLVAGAAIFMQMSSFNRSGEYLTWRIRQMAFRAMLRQDISYFDDHFHTTGALTTRLATDASAVQGATGSRLGTICQSICSVGVGLVIGMVFSWKLTLVILAFVPFMVAAGLIQTQMYMGFSTGGQEAMEEAGKTATEALENIRTVASLTKEPEFDQKYNKLMDIPFKQNMRKSHIVGVSFAFSQAIVFFAYAAAFSFGAWLIENDGLSFVNMFKVFSAVVFGAMAVGEANAYAPDYNKAKVAARRMFKLFDIVPSIDTYSPLGDIPESCIGSIEFQDVEFHYPTRPDITVLQGLNIQVKPGQRLALVGSSGCGKSTTVQLIERFYDPRAGRITLDGQDLCSLNIKWMRAQIGIVSQEPVLFDSSIYDNIAYGDNSREAHMDEVISAARAANIHQFIESLPNGYDTNVGDKGTQLSGGQKQRVAIARALLRNPKILLLDEATSALDTESEKVVQEALDKAQEGRTSIVIAHRLSTIQNADCIVVISNGKVVERGTHVELMGAKGVYFNLNSKQTVKQSSSSSKLDDPQEL